MECVGAFEAKTNLARLLGRVRRGEQFTITRHGVPVALLVPAKGQSRSDIHETIEEIHALRRSVLTGSNGALTERIR